MEMFRNVVKPSITIGSRKWYTVPVSLGTHGLIVVALIVLPVLAPGLLPMPDATTVFTVAAPPPPLPPPPAVARSNDEPPPANVNAAPTVAPTSITKEPDVVPGFENTNGVPGGDVIAGQIVRGFTDEAPPPSAPAAPLRVGGQIRPPTKIAEAPLVYPPMAIAARVDGTVIIEATIGADGHVLNARILRGKPLLDQAALDAVRTWEYTPTLLNGVPVAVIMTVVVQFRLQ